MSPLLFKSHQNSCWLFIPRDHLGVVLLHETLKLLLVLALDVEADSTEAGGLFITVGHAYLSVWADKMASPLF